MTSKIGCIALVLLSAGCGPQSGEEAGLHNPDESGNAASRSNDDWLAPLIADVLARDISTEGTIRTSQEGRFEVGPTTLICGHPPEIDPVMRDHGENWLGLDGAPIDAALVRLGLSIHVDGASRHTQVISRRCGAPADGQVQYRGWIRLNSEKRPYRLDIVVWQHSEEQRAFWAGSIARPHFQTWDGPLRIDREGNLPNGQPYWSIGGDATALTEQFAPLLTSGG